jgi:hypothetical protein
MMRVHVPSARRGESQGGTAGFILGGSRRPISRPERATLPMHTTGTNYVYAFVLASVAAVLITAVREIEPNPQAARIMRALIFVTAALAIYAKLR